MFLSYFLFDDATICIFSFSYRTYQNNKFWKFMIFVLYFCTVVTYKGSNLMKCVHVIPWFSRICFCFKLNCIFLWWFLWELKYKVFLYVFSCCMLKFCVLISFFFSFISCHGLARESNLKSCNVPKLDRNCGGKQDNHLGRVSISFINFIIIFIVKQNQMIGNKDMYLGIFFLTSFLIKFDFSKSS